MNLHPPPRTDAMNELRVWFEELYEYIKTTEPSYGCLALDTEPTHVAASYTEVSGATIASGTVVDTRTTNQTYLQVEEDQKFDIQFTFTGLLGYPAKCQFAGRYVGNPAHDVFLYVWNYTLTQWDRVTAAANDFISSATDESLHFDLPNTADYLSGTECKLRIYHDSSAVASHDMYIDYINVSEATLELPTSGTAVQLTGMDELQSNNMTLDGSGGEITVITGGDYQHLITISFEGSSSAVIGCDLYVNGSKEIVLFHRMLSDTGDVGSAASTAIRAFNVGDVVSWHFYSDVDDAFISIVAIRVSLLRLRLL